MDEARRERPRFGMVFGNLAFDFDLTEEARYAAPPAAEAAPGARPRRDWARWLGLGLGGVLALLLLTAAIFGRMRLTALDSRASAAEAELTALKAERAALRLEYEQTFDLAGVEAYATDVLGMRRPRGDQVRYADAETADRAQVLDAGGAASPEERVLAAIDSIAACFHR